MRLGSELAFFIIFVKIIFCSSLRFLWCNDTVYRLAKRYGSSSSSSFWMRLNYERPIDPLRSVSSFFQTSSTSKSLLALSMLRTQRTKSAFLTLCRCCSFKKARGRPWWLARRSQRCSLSKGVLTWKAFRCASTLCESFLRLPVPRCSNFTSRASSLVVVTEVLSPWPALGNRRRLANSITRVI